MFSALGRLTHYSSVRKISLPVHPNAAVRGTKIDANDVVIFFRIDKEYVVICQQKCEKNDLYGSMTAERHRIESFAMARSPSFWAGSKFSLTSSLLPISATLLHNKRVPS